MEERYSQYVGGIVAGKYEVETEQRKMENGRFVMRRGREDIVLSPTCPFVSSYKVCEKPKLPTSIKLTKHNVTYDPKQGTPIIGIVSNRIISHYCPSTILGRQDSATY